MQNTDVIEICHRVGAIPINYLAQCLHWTIGDKRRRNKKYIQHSVRNMCMKQSPYKV